jgi:phage shock protein A
VSLWARIAGLIAGEARPRTARPDDPGAAVDAAYRAQLEAVDDVRARLVELLAARARLEMQLASSERSGADPSAVDAFRAEIAVLRAREDELAAAVDDLRRRADGLRAERDVTRARVAAAQAGIAANGLLAGLNPAQTEIRGLLEDARRRTLALQAWEAALGEMAGQAPRPPRRVEARVERDALNPPAAALEPPSEAG